MVHSHVWLLSNTSRAGAGRSTPSLRMCRSYQCTKQANLPPPSRTQPAIAGTRQARRTDGAEEQPDPLAPNINAETSPWSASRSTVRYAAREPAWCAAEPHDNARSIRQPDASTTMHLSALRERIPEPALGEAHRPLWGRSLGGALPLDCVLPFWVVPNVSGVHVRGAPSVRDPPSVGYPRRSAPTFAPSFPGSLTASSSRSGAVHR